MCVYSWLERVEVENVVLRNDACVDASTSFVPKSSGNT